MTRFYTLRVFRRMVGDPPRRDFNHKLSLLEREGYVKVQPPPS